MDLTHKDFLERQAFLRTSAFQSLFRDGAIADSVNLTSRDSQAIMPIIPSVQLGVEMRVYGLVFKSLEEFFISIDFEHNDEISVLMNRVCKNFVANKVTLTLSPGDEGRIVSSLYKTDMKWYRAQVLRVEKDYVRVHYIDYGNEDSVPLDNILPLPKCVASIPMGAIKCSLAHYNKILHSKFENELLEALPAEVFAGLVFSATFIEQTKKAKPAEETWNGMMSPPTYSIDLARNGQSIFESIIRKDFSPNEIPEFNESLEWTSGGEVNVVVGDQPNAVGSSQMKATGDDLISLADLHLDDSNIALTPQSLILDMDATGSLI